ncbi:RNA pseudouridine synthase 1 [Physcomitrium patens]|nr:RNA pseudouridine synthase 1-like [Physcomitrium patens]XP_024360655.1 RNA pseudouridine synthase 1-like [Physcomitrium patens]PNR30875.1 hypothetical protein PHYPA_027191 [Physcomitrium patens]|eukprot:XP_024360654.1 RNA pseudouridine synthase 1-like [Physcomitrella patens]
MYHASCPARAVTFLPWHSKVQTRVGIRSLEFVFSPLPARMRSSVVAHSMVIKESCGEVDSVLKLDYPVPLSPVPSQLSNEVELQRALVAEAAMKSRPAIGRESVLFEDEWLIIVNKPRGLYSGHVFETMPSLCSSSGETPLHLHMANRLDRDTSGIMIITKCKVAAANLTRSYMNRKVHKTYIAQCAQSQPTWRKSRIESGHGRSRYGAWHVYAKHDIGRRLPVKTETVREMITRLEIVSGPDSLRWDNELSVEHDCLEVIVGSEDEVRLVSNEVTKRCSDVDEEVTLVRAFPETGRTHQIRLHCQYLGLPLCGDVKYGGPLFWQSVHYDSHTLHAESLALRHPMTNQLLQVVAPYPSWAVQLGVKPFEHKTCLE